MNILELSEKRFSARKYTAEPVAQSDLEYIMECVRLAPSAVNKQPWKFVIVRSEEAKQKLWRAYDREWFRTAPLYIVCMKNNNACWTRSYDDKKHGDASANNAAKLMKRLGNPARFGFPVFVVLDSEGNVLHIQDSSFLEEGKGYSEKKVLRFFKNWTPKAVENKQ